MDFSFLRAEPFELPDPQALAIRGMTLANLSQTNQEGQMKLDALRQAQDVKQAAAKVFGDAQTMGWDAAIKKAAQEGNTLGAAAALQLRRQDEGDAAKIENDRAQANERNSAATKNTMQAKVDGFKQFASITTGMASGMVPVNDATMSAAYETARAILPDNVVRTIPADPARFKEWAATMADPKVQSDIWEKLQTVPAKINLDNANANRANVEAQYIPQDSQSRRITANASAQSAGTGAARLKFEQDQAKTDPGKWTYDPDRGISVNAATQTALPVMAGGKPIGGKKDPALEQRNQNTLEMVDRVLQEVQAVKPNIGPTNTGLVGKIAGMVPGSAAYDLKAKVESIKSNLGFEQLTALRAASPTGGALGAVSEKENTYLQNAVANLDTAQSDEQMVEQLGKVERHLNNVKALISGKMPAQGAAGKIGGAQTFDSMPDPRQYEGRRMQAPDGTIYRARGGKWMRE